jgi:hypothetical protein
MAKDKNETEEKVAPQAPFAAPALDGASVQQLANALEGLKDVVGSVGKVGAASMTEEQMLAVSMRQRAIEKRAPEPANICVRVQASRSHFRAGLRWPSVQELRQDDREAKPYTDKWVTASQRKALEEDPELLVKETPEKDWPEKD